MLKNMEENLVNDYRITWRFCTLYDNAEYTTDKLLFLMKHRVCSMALDSNMYFYKLDNDELTLKKFELDCDHGVPRGQININEDIEFNKQEQHYIIEISGMLIHRNMMFDDLNQISTLYMVLEPIYLTYDNLRINLYPLVKLRKGLIMIEYRAFPGDNILSCQEFINNYSEIFHKKIDNIEIDVNLFHAIYPKAQAINVKNIMHDGCAQAICELPTKDFPYLKDISISIFRLFISEMNFDWIGRTTYSLNPSVIDEKMVMPLLYSYGKNAQIIYSEKPINYREFNDYKHYVTAGTSMTLGDIMQTYMFADSIDEEILFSMTQTERLRCRIDKCRDTDSEELIKLYKEILNFKHDYLKKYNHLLIIHRIMEDIWNNFGIEQAIKEIETLIELRLKESENLKNKQFSKIQMLFSIVTVLLSSAPIYEYLVLPGFSLIQCKNIETIATIDKMVLFLGTLVISSLVIWLITKLCKKD